jgi:hypothetical protein
LFDLARPTDFVVNFFESFVFLRVPGNLKLVYVLLHDAEDMNIERARQMAATHSRHTSKTAQHISMNFDIWGLEKRLYEHTLYFTWRLSNTSQISQKCLIHAFGSLSYERSKTSSPHSANQSFLFQVRVSSPFLKVIQ